MFTKEHYIKIAKLIKNFDLPPTRLGEIVHVKLILSFIELFEDDNSTFSKEEFAEAIYGEEKK